MSALSVEVSCLDMSIAFASSTGALSGVNPTGVCSVIPSTIAMSAIGVWALSSL